MCPTHIRQASFHGPNPAREYTAGTPDPHGALSVATAALTVQSNYRLFFRFVRSPERVVVPDALGAGERREAY